MTGNEYILKRLAAEGIDKIFLVPGGLIDPFLPAFAKVPEITPIVAAQEGGAAYMADGYARASGKFGACIAIGGPGITNMTTPVSTAYTDGSAILVLSGEVPTNIEGCGQFQDASAGTFNDTEILKNITAFSASVENPQLLKHHLNSAMIRMLSQPRRPVHISLPQDAQLTETDEQYKSLCKHLTQGRFIDLEATSHIWSKIKPEGEKASAKKIAILAGAGTIYSEASESLKEFAERFSIPVATTQKAKGALPENHPLSLGVFGYAGTRDATNALLSEELDLLIILGSSMKVRDTMYWSSKLAPTRGSVIVNISPSDLGEIYQDNKTSVVADIKTFLDHLLSEDNREHNDLLKDGISTREQWLQNIRQSGPRFYDKENCQSNQVPIHPARAVSELQQVMPKDTVLLVDSGAHRAFAVHYWESKSPGLFISATNLGPMGWAIPAAVGAKLARPELPCTVITGDGCMLMHGMEIQTAKRYELPIIYVVFNNSALANVWLRAHHEGPVPAELTSLPDHDWAGFARSLGLEASTVTEPEDLNLAFKKALDAKTTYLIDVKVEKNCSTPIEPYKEAQKLWSFQE